MRRFVSAAIRLLPKLVLPVVILSGCALHTQPPPVDAPEQVWAEQRARREALSHWEINGKLALNTPVKSGTASFHWRHTPEADVLDIRGPLGSGHARLEVDAEGAQLTDSSGKQTLDKDAETLLLNSLGWEIPVGGLYAWVRGIPLADVLFVYELDESGRLSKLIQDGWEIKYRGWREVGDLELPRKIFMKTLPVTNEPLKPIDVRLVIREWKLQ